MFSAETLNNLQALLERIPALNYQSARRKPVYCFRQSQLYHYQSQNKVNRGTPLLIIFASFNGPEILDLQQNNSFIGALLQQQLNVYLLDWGQATSDTNFAAYVEALAACVMYITKKYKIEAINMLGICQGGVVSLCYAALHSQVKNLVLISTPVDFHAKSYTLAHLVRQLDTKKIALKEIPGRLITQFFISLKPFELLGKKYLRALDQIKNKTWMNKFLLVEKWLQDTPNQPKKVFVEFVDAFFKKNKLCKGTYVLNKQKISLKKIKIPILNILATNDSIVNENAIKPLKHLIGSVDYTLKKIVGGHIGIYISDKSVGLLAKQIASWLKKRNNF